MANTYKKRVKADELNVEGGYKNVVLFAPRDTFLNLANPTPSLTPRSGDKIKITNDHTFGVDDGFISWLCTQHTVTLTAETTGDNSKSIVYTAKFNLLGDSASTQEQLQALINDSCIFLLKDGDCHAAQEYIQLGDDCNTPEVAVSFDGKTTKEGQKEYTVTLTMKGKKYWYYGTVTEKPEEADFYPVSAQVANANPNKIVVTFNKAVNATTIPLYNSFAITGSAAVNPTNAAIVVSGLTITITASANFVSSDTILLSYIKDTPYLQDMYGSQADTFLALPVTNNVA